MLRYYVIATAIVVALGSLVFARRFTAPDLRIEARPTGTPTVETHHAEDAIAPAAFAGQGPWVLSALPECFDEQSRVRGPAAALAGRVPPATARIPAGTILTSGACSLTVGAYDIRVRRGPDRLRVPPEAALYRVDGRLVLVARSGGDLEIRRY